MPLKYYLVNFLYDFSKIDPLLVKVSELKNFTTLGEYLSSVFSFSLPIIHKFFDFPIEILTGWIPQCVLVSIITGV